MVGKPTTGPEEARHDFIDDEESALFLHQGGGFFEIAAWVHEETGGSLNERLYDHAGETWTGSGDCFLNGMKAFPLALAGEAGIGSTDRLRPVEGAAVTSRRRQRLAGEEEVVEGAMELGALAQAHRADGVPVVGRAEGEKFRPFGGSVLLKVLGRDFQGGLDGGGTVIGKKAAIEMRTLR